LSGWLYTFASINFLYFCIILFLVCVTLMIVVSLLTSPPSFEQIKGLTYATTVAEDKARSRASWNLRDLILSLIVLAIIALVLIYFSPLVLS
jgi:SSS family solute:Na+ symporter